MFGSEILEIALGLTFIYLLLSLIASAVTEVIEAFRKKRASDLERGIRTLLADSAGTGLAKQFYDHPLISSLTLGRYDPNKISGGRYATGSKLPSYIPSRSFALALMDLFLPTSGTRQGGGEAAPKPLTDLKATVDAIGNDHIRKTLGSFVNVAGNDLDGVRQELEAWYDSGMDRVSGWYKRYAQWVLLAVGLVIAAVVNADTVALSRSLAQDDRTREAMLEAVQTFAVQQDLISGQEALTVVQQAGAAPTQLRQLSEPQLAAYLGELQRVGLPLGWNAEDPRAFPRDLLAWVSKLLGWLLTAFAISLGAPFWFDLLNKFMVIRSTVRPYEKSPPEPPVDGTPPARGAARPQAVEAGSPAA